MEVTGKIIRKLDLQSGTSKAGKEWKKQAYVLQTLEQYPKTVCNDFFGDKVDQFPLQIGDNATIAFDIDSREYNGRWYTDIHAWKADVQSDSKPQEVAGVSAEELVKQAEQSKAEQKELFTGATNTVDDLPF